MKYLYIIIIALFPLLLMGQNVEFSKDNFPPAKHDGLKEAKRNIKDGNDYFEQSLPGYQAALEYYLKAYNFNPSNADLNYKIGKCYLESVQKVKSIPYLESAFKINPTVGETKNGPSDVQHLLARAYHLDNQFDKAITTYRMYMNSLSPAELSLIQDEVNRSIEMCETAKVMVQEPVRVYIDNIGAPINTIHPEYSPLISADETMLMFTSCQPGTTGGERDPLDNRYYEDILISYRLEDGRWGDPVNPGRPFNSYSHDAAVGFSPDSRYVLIYKGDVNGGDIFLCAVDENGEWGAPRSISRKVNSHGHESSAAFAPDMSYLYFISDRNGGFGGKDIYRSPITFTGKNNDKMEFGDPENLGAMINSPYDETGLFLQSNGREIYFSSRGHASMGGFDIFKSEFKDNMWSAPENIGYPVNTPGDDVFFSITADGKHGYYSTWKPDGIGDRDIFIISFLGDMKDMIPEEIIEEPSIAHQQFPVNILPVDDMKGDALVLLKGTIRDKVTNEPLGVVVDIMDNEELQPMASFESNATTGKYMVTLPSGKSYGFSIQADEYPFYSEILEIPAANTYTEITKDILLEKLTVGSKIILNNIFFDFNKASLRDVSIAELNRVVKMMEDHKTLKIQISGHTDNVGSDEYNQDLSERRAQSVVNYLIASGIPADRLEYKGYGESQPIAGNDTDEGRQMNRRTEFEVLDL